MARSSAPRSARLKPAADRRSACPIAGVLDLLGDRWTLLVIRDLFFGKSRFGEFLASPEGIPTNILAERLERLESAGMIARTPYQQHPPRFAYSLTPGGRDLKNVIFAVADWGLHHLPGTRLDPRAATLTRGSSES